MLDTAALNILVPAVVSVIVAFFTATIERAKINQKIAALQAENQALREQREVDRAEFNRQMSKMDERYNALKSDHDSLQSRYEAALKAQAGWRGGF